MTGGLSGPAIKPITMRLVYEASRAVKIPVIGLGGVEKAEDVLEYLIVGARAVQVGTANFSRPDSCQQTCRWAGKMLYEYIRSIISMGWSDR